MGLSNAEGLLRDFHGASVGIQWKFHGAVVLPMSAPTGLPWEPHGASIGVLWGFTGLHDFRGTSMRPSWDLDEASIGLPWDFDGTSMAFPSPQRDRV